MEGYIAAEFLLIPLRSVFSHQERRISVFFKKPKLLCEHVPFSIGATNNAYIYLFSFIYILSVVYHWIVQGLDVMLKKNRFAFLLIIV